MNETLPIIGSKSFWNIYDKFCRSAHLRSFIKDGASNLAPQMCAIMEAAHRSREMHLIKSRPERGWRLHAAWLALRNAPVRNDRGVPVTYMRPGDVVVVEWGWDRDVVITHSPNTRTICGLIRSGKWNEEVGLFMPLFERCTIIQCIKWRTAKNALEALALAEKEAQDWDWR